MSLCNNVDWISLHYNSGLCAAVYGSLSTMCQRAGITRHPWSVLLLIVVLASAYPTAESSAEGLGCKEIVPSEGCVAVSVSKVRTNAPSTFRSPCDGWLVY